MDEFGEFAALAPLLVTFHRLREAYLDHDLVWVLPANVLVGVTKAWGIEVIRADVPEALLAHRPHI